ncbi:MAG: formylglycine-generating enzyme family protein, partial [Victivallales bacterium]|nr:formylglycine-generating enzyme family protein [Victivallales bacterium]
MKTSLLLMLFSLSCNIYAVNTQMMEIPSGKFTRSDGKTIQIKSFSILNTEITWSQFKAVKDWANKQGYEINGGIGQTDLPAQNISWYDAVKWCNALSEMSGKTPVYYFNGQLYKKGNADLTNKDVKWDADGYRLPTEAEWEYAYRAGTSTCFYWGEFPREGEPVNHEYAVFHFWGTEEINGGPLRGGSKKPNAFGLYDMAGNMEEWVWDRYSLKYKNVGTDNPKGPDTGFWRVLRGGGFVIDRIFTADARHMSYPFWINCDIGFRIASSNPKADTKTLNSIKVLPLNANDTKPYSSQRNILDIRKNCDEDTCKRLFPLLDLNAPSMKSVKTAYLENNYSEALTHFRNIMLERIKTEDWIPWPNDYIDPRDRKYWESRFEQKRPFNIADFQNCWQLRHNNIF